MMLIGSGNKTNLTGGSGDDILIGSNNKDTLKGDDGNDILKGGDGNDKLFGGDGNDTLDGGDGNDLIEDQLGTNFIDGGAGFNTLIIKLPKSEFRITKILEAVTENDEGFGYEYLISHKTDPLLKNYIKNISRIKFSDVTITKKDFLS